MAIAVHEAIREATDSRQMMMEMLNDSRHSQEALYRSLKTTWYSSIINYLPLTENMNVADFIEQFNRIALFNNWSREKSAHIFQLQLEGPARSWLRNQSLPNSTETAT